MTTPKKPSPKGKPNRKQKKSRDGKGQNSLIHDLQKKMETCPNAETLNDQVITPFIQALVSVCDARGYVLNIYGDHCNLAITPEEHAESLFQLIESYLDNADLE
ncbi:MAG: hypothetical protein GKS03_09965 [Alphaproteobacteria bacterium]|nr:hypothetical protein [Alphaproteobacteria bacterium]